MFGFEHKLDSEVDLGGMFIAEVVENLDPKALERVRVRVIGVHDMKNTEPNNSIWANHMAYSKSNSGEIPDIGDYVYVMFLQKSPMHPIWMGWVRTLAG